MNKSNNVIDLKTRKPVTPKAGKTSSLDPLNHGVPGQVVDMTARRNEVLNQERRKVKRTILSEFIGAFLVVPQKGLCKVALHDISENGLAFEIEVEKGQFTVGEEVAFRVYMNQQTYFPFVVKISNMREDKEEGVYRHGANFVKGTVNDEALFHFVRFIETVSASLQTDHGDVMVSNLLK
jgi:hypothetical protein